MMGAVIKKSLLVSLLGHIAVFSIFNFTFGNMFSNKDYSRVYFFGQILRNSDLGVSQFMLNRNYDLAVSQFRPLANSHTGIYKQAGLSALDKTRQSENLIEKAYVKPLANLVFASSIPKAAAQKKPFLLAKKKSEPVIMLYPNLPPHFLLYFKDRQMVHIELMYKATSSKINYAQFMRKISSGNLEADLLSMRYISHYFFIRQSAALDNKWATVKIDLSAKDEK